MIKFFKIALFLLLFFVSSGQALANEGRITLKDGNRICEAISYWDESAYKIAGRCSGLTYPYNGELDRYILWVKRADGVIDQVAEVDSGVIEGRVRGSFDSLFVTAEMKGYSTKAPEGPQVLSGQVEKFGFAEPRSPTVVDTSEDTEAPLASPLAAAQTPAPTKLGKVFSGAGATFLVVFGAIVLVIILLTRGR